MSDTVTAAYPFDLLVRARDESGKNNSQIAREAKISRPKVIEVFQGKSANMEHIRAVAAALNVEVEVSFIKAA